MIDFRAIEEKWQQKWERSKIFEPEPDDREKYFITVPFPYTNGLLHLGFGFTSMRAEALGRYKLMKGYNVLRPQGFHVTGSPIVGAATQLREGSKKIREILKSYKIPEEEIEEFKNPEKWVFYFTEKAKKALEKIGYAIDKRRYFYTTELNKAFSKFVKWQYRKLYEKGYIYQGSLPVVWDYKANIVVGDHDRGDEYAGIRPSEGYIIKFRLNDPSLYNKLKTENIYLPCFTLRPETIYGVTNIWINPTTTYKVFKVNNEYWILPNNEIIFEEAKNQDIFLEDTGIILESKDLIKKFVINPITKEEVPILPALFVDPTIGTGIVMSVPAHAPYDYIGLRDIINKEEILKEYIDDTIIALAERAMNNLKILFDSQEFKKEEIPAKKIVESSKVKNQLEKDILDDLTQKLYSTEYYKSILKEMYGPNFAGKYIHEIKEEFSKYYLEKGLLIKYYTLPIRFKSRYGNVCVVKIVKDQWFIKYSDPKWKELAHKCIDRMTTIPDEVKKHLHITIDWLHDWACTHQNELGTEFPFEEGWVIESLSDSTIYPAYYILAKYLEHPKRYNINVDYLKDSFFDYVLLGKGDPEKVAKENKIDKEILENIRKEFEYWYPVDMRLSAKDLIQNHLAFYIFHHVAIFPENKWPKGIAINGWVLINGEKMSKSKGNVIPILFAVEEHGADPVRFILAYAGDSGYEDPNIEYNKINLIKEELKNWYIFAINNYNKGREEEFLIDKWFENELNKTVKIAEKHYEKINTKSLLVECFYKLQNLFKWYHKRTKGNYNKKVINKYIEIQTKILWPIIPHITSEILEKLKIIDKNQLIPTWPKVEEPLEELEKLEELIKDILEDSKTILNLLKNKGITPSKLKIILASKDKYNFIQRLHEKSRYEKELVKIFESIDKDLLKKYGNIVPKLKKNPKIIYNYLDRELEYTAIKEASEFISEELGLKVEISFEESEGDNPKAKQALPSKPALVFT